MKEAAQSIQRIGGFPLQGSPKTLVILVNFADKEFVTPDAQNAFWRLLNEATREEILTMKRENPRQYQYWYLGQKISLEGLVLYTFNKERNLIPLERFKEAVAAKGYQPLYVIYGVDSGVVKDPTAVCAWGIFPDGTLVKLSTFYLDPKEGGEPLPNSYQVERIGRVTE